MKKPIFDTLLSKSEWDALQALNKAGCPASTRAVHELMVAQPKTLAGTHQILKRLQECVLIDCTNFTFDGPYGPEHRVVWSLNANSTILFS